MSALESYIQEVAADTFFADLPALARRRVLTLSCLFDHFLKASAASGFLDNINRRKPAELDLQSVGISSAAVYDSESRGDRLLERCRLDPQLQRLVLMEQLALKAASILTTVLAASICISRLSPYICNLSTWQLATRWKRCRLQQSPQRRKEFVEQRVHECVLISAFVSLGLQSRQRAS